MTNYNLEEFKAWLEEDETRKEGLTERWESGIFKFTEPNYFQGFVEGHKGTAVYFQPYRQIVLKWKAQVDHQRERERESKAKMRRYPLAW